MNNRVPKFGEVYLINFVGCDSVQNGWRPGLIFQNNIGNEYSPNIIALPLTTSLKKLNQPTHVIVRSIDSGLLKDSIVLCENPESVSKNKIGAFITELPRKYLEKIAMASLLSTSAISLLSIDDIIKLRDKAVSLNTVSY